MLKKSSNPRLKVECSFVAPVEFDPDCATALSALEEVLKKDVCWSYAWIKGQL